MMMLILDAATAEAVRGPTGLGAALDPRRLADGDFALPERVLSDPAHVEHHGVLSSLPRRHADDCLWPAPSEDDDG